MKHFTIQELSHTSKAIENHPTPDATRALEALVINVLDPARALLGTPIHVNSGYRNPLLNRAVGGAPTSQHTRGEAADLDAGSKAENQRLYNIIVENCEFDQLINEHDFSWVHVSYRAGANRGQQLKIG